MHGGHEGFNWLSQIPALASVPHHFAMALIIMAVLLVTGAAATFLLKRAANPVIPDATLTYRNFFDVLAEQLYSLCVSVMGKHNAHEYFPIIGTLFIFIFTCNLFGLIPGFLPPTDNMNVTLAAGAFVFLYYNFQGFRKNGLGYIKHFFGPVWFIAPLMFVIELISHVVRPMSLALRLRSNIMGDHMVLGIFGSLTPYGVPVIFYGLGLFVSFMQAFVFCLLTMVYISLSTAHDH